MRPTGCGRERGKGVNSKMSDWPSGCRRANKSNLESS